MCSLIKSRADRYSLDHTNLDQNTPSVKKLQPRIGKGHAEKKWNQNGQPRPPAIDGNKIFDNDDQAAKHYCCLPLTSSSWQATVMFCGLVIIKKINSINNRRPWSPFWFHIFQHGLSRFLAITFLCQGCFGWDFTSFLHILL